MLDKFVLISKDVFMRGYLPIYGNKYNKTPNIDELAEKGTVFNKHYTAAPSTAMAFTSMFTGLYAFQTDRKKYVEVSEFEADTLFDKLEKEGYQCHIVWDQSYVNLAQRFSKCYGKKPVFHNTTFLTRSQPNHIMGRYDDMTFYPELTNKCVEQMEALTREIYDSSKKVFMWVHFPHVLMGRNAYGSDIDVLDRMIGVIRRIFGDESIYITADHGHMNGSHGKFGYGFDVNEQAIRIPLITPRICDLKSVDFPTSNIQLQDILFGKLSRNEVIYSETAYYMQHHRKLAIIKDNYKYIYEKATGKEYMYDVDWDPEENINLLATEIHDVDRKKNFSITQRFFYPHWNDGLEEKAMEFRRLKTSMWRNAPWHIEVKERLIHNFKLLYVKLFRS